MTQTPCTPRSPSRVMRVYDTLMINMFKRYFAPKRQQLAISLQMGDERVVAHMD